VTVGTLENTAVSVSYDANGDTEFPTTFAFLDEEHLLVETSDDDGDTWTTLVLGTDYEVTGASDPEPGGNVSTAGLLGAVPNGTTVRITRQTPITQLNSFRTTGALPVTTIQESFVKLTMIAQEERAKSAALEALSGLVTVTDLADGARVAETFTTDADDVESTFPFDITVPGGESATNAIFRVFPNGDDGHRFDTPPVVQWTPTALNTISIVAIDGLDPNTEYVLAGLVIF
jgi:hypothetical protein